MANYISLYSGSSGNCSVIEDNGKFILIDIGKSARMTTNALKELGLEEGDMIRIENYDMEYWEE